MDIRKTVMICETVFAEAGKPAPTPIYRVAAITVFNNLLQAKTILKI